MPDPWPDSARPDDGGYDPTRKQRFPNALKDQDGAWRRLVDGRTADPLPQSLRPFDFAFWSSGDGVRNRSPGQPYSFEGGMRRQNSDDAGHISPFRSSDEISQSERSGFAIRRDVLPRLYASTEQQPVRQQVSSSIRERPASIDPAQTQVFQPGPDGKLRSIPGWHTTSPDDFGGWSKNIDWKGVGHDLGNIAQNSFDVLTLGAGAEASLARLGYKLSPSALSGKIVLHHGYPMFMGGARKQTLAPIIESVHTDYHPTLSSALKKAGFPPVGGRTGSTERWLEYFRQNPEREAEANRILEEVTRKFDRQNNTGFSGYITNARRTFTPWRDGHKPVTPPPD